MEKKIINVTQSYTKTPNTTNIVSLEMVIKGIQSGLFKDKIEEIRATTDSEEQSRLKESLPMYSYFGEFHKREAKGILASNGLFVFDLDVNKESDRSDIEDEVNSIFAALYGLFPYIAFYFRTPRKGLKLGVLTNFRTTDAFKYQQVYNVLMGRIRQQLSRQGVNFSHIDFDTSVTDISRGHFISYDKNAYINDDASEIEINYERLVAANSTVVNTGGFIDSKIDIDNPINILLVKEVIEFFKNSGNKLKIGVGFHQNNINWMFALRRCFNSGLAKDFCIELFQTQGIYTADKFEKYWNCEEREIINPVGIGTIFHLAKEGGFEFGNKDLEMFEKAYSQKDLLSEQNTVHDFVIKKYLSEVSSDLNNVISSNKKVQIVSETGSGKTTFFMDNYASSENKTIFLVPYTSMAISFSESAKKKGNVIPIQYSGTKSDIEAEVNNGANLIMSTYDGLKTICNTIKDCSNYTLVIDEIHNIIPVYSYRKEAVRNIVELGDRFKNVVCLTGTPLSKELMDKSPFFNGMKTVKVKSNKATNKRVQFIPTDDVLQSVANRVLSLKGKGEKTAVFYQNCDKNQELSNILSYHGLKTVIVNSTTKDCKETLELLKREILEADAVVGTYSLIDGLNLLNLDIKEIHIVGVQPVRYIQQFANRFRYAVSDLDIYIHVKENELFNIGSSSINRLHSKVKEETLRYESLAKLLSESFEVVKGKSAILNTFGGLVLPNNNYSPLSTLMHCYYYDDYSSSFEVDETGILWEVQRQMDEIECRNPFLFIQELIKYDFVFEGILEPFKSKIDTGDKVDYWQIAVSEFKKASEKNEVLGSIRLRISRFFDEHIATKSAVLNGMTKKHCTLLYQRFGELVKLGYKDETALKIVCEAPKSEGKYLTNVTFPFVVNSLVENDGIKHVSLFAELDKRLVQNKPYTNNDLKAILEQSELAVFDKIHTKQPLSILRKFYEVKISRPRNNGSKNNSYLITGYKELKYKLDGIISDSGYEAVLELTLGNVFGLAA